jgi:hypothetical protein
MLCLPGKVKKTKQKVTVSFRREKRILLPGSLQVFVVGVKVVKYEEMLMTREVEGVRKERQSAECEMREEGRDVGPGGCVPALLVG